MNNIKIAGGICFLFIVMNIIWPTGHDTMAGTLIIAYLLVIGFSEMLHAIDEVSKNNDKTA